MRTEDDRRIRKTKTVIRQTLTRLLMEKDLKDISVSELTEFADINRGTFYLHYKDIYDLFEKVEEEILAEFTSIIAKHKEHMFWMPVFYELFQYIAANSQFFIAILRTKETTFLNQIIDMNRPQTKEEWRKLFAGGKEEFYEYYYSFITYGCVAMLRKWFDNGMPESPARMAELAEKMMTNCIKNLS